MRPAAARNRAAAAGELTLTLALTPTFESGPDPDPHPDHRLQAQGLRVSLLYRKHVPASMQSPSSAGLAALLGVAGFDEAELLQGRP